MFSVVYPLPCMRRVSAALAHRSAKAEASGGFGLTGGAVDCAPPLASAAHVDAERRQGRG
eukprot:scaffold2135_cov341-Prasinococcus_capsulatus_cf.AAC.8